MDYKYITTFVALLLLVFVFNKFKTYYSNNENAVNYKQVRQHLLNGSRDPLALTNKRVMWIHTKNEINSSNWASFGSRNTTNLNQPYKLITLKTILDKCGKDFDIYLIDDNSFEKLIPNWKIKINDVAEPVRSNIRRLAMARLLKTYGGMVVPSSFICLKNLRNIYDSAIKETGIFVGELMNAGNSGPSKNPNLSYPSMRLMGCKKNCSAINNYVKHLEKLNSTDYTAESSFIGDDVEWCMEKITNSEMKMIPGHLLGARDAQDRIITFEQLMGNSYLDVSSEAVGIYIPDDEVLRRTKYQWFARLSPGQALTSDTNIGKYLVIASSVMSK